MTQLFFFHRKSPFICCFTVVRVSPGLRSNKTFSLHTDAAFHKATMLKVCTEIPEIHFVSGYCCMETQPVIFKFHALTSVTSNILCAGKRKQEECAEIKRTGSWNKDWNFVFNFFFICSFHFHPPPLPPQSLIQSWLMIKMSKVIRGSDVRLWFISLKWHLRGRWQMIHHSDAQPQHHDNR